MDDITRQIETFRKANRMNKQTLCSFARINRNSYTNYLKGTQSMSNDVLQRICSALGLKVILIDKNI